MKKTSLIIMITAFLFSGCAAVQETYKPLYQVKPEVKQIKGK